MFIPRAVSKFLEFGEFLMTILGNSRFKEEYEEDKFYFVGNYRKITCTSCFFFQFIFLLLFTAARNDCATQELPFSS